MYVCTFVFYLQKEFDFVFLTIFMLHAFYFVLSVYCNDLMYWIASSIMSSCESFPDCCMSGNIFFSFSMSAWLMLDVSSSTSPIFTPMMVVIAADVFHSTDSDRLTSIQSSTAQEKLIIPDKHCGVLFILWGQVRFKRNRQTVFYSFRCWICRMEPASGLGKILKG